MNGTVFTTVTKRQFRKKTNMPPTTDGNQMKLPTECFLKHLATGEDATAP